MRTYLPLLAADEERVTVVGGPSDPVGRHKKRKEIKKAMSGGAMSMLILLQLLFSRARGSLQPTSALPQWGRDLRRLGLSGSE